MLVKRLTLAAGVETAFEFDEYAAKSVVVKNETADEILFCDGPFDAAKAAHIPAFSWQSLNVRVFPGETPAFYVKATVSGVVEIDFGPSGMGVLGNVKLSGSNTGDKVTASVTRPDNATPYAIGDVVGLTTYLEFANVGIAGQEIAITDVNLTIKKAATNLAVPAGMSSFLLYLYTDAPTAIADNDAWVLGIADVDKYAKVKLVLGTPTDMCDVLVSENTAFNRTIKLVGTSLYGYLVTSTAYTPVALTVQEIDLHYVGL